jgi:hypothetical protein
LFASVWASGWPQLERQGFLIVAVLLAASVGKIVVSSLVLNALARRISPFSFRGVATALELVLPFAFLFLTLITTLVIILGGYIVFLPSLGTLLEPRFGERGTDLTELGLLGTLGLLSACLVLVADLTRTHLALGGTSLHHAFRLACHGLRHRTFRFLLQATPRAVAALVLYATALYLHFRWQGNPALPLAPLLAVAVIELAAAVSTWLYLDWLVAALRLCENPAANDGA